MSAFQNFLHFIYGIPGGVAGLIEEKTKAKASLVKYTYYLYDEITVQNVARHAKRRYFNSSKRRRSG